MLVVISSLQCVFMCLKLQDTLASDGYGILGSCRKAAGSSEFILERENSCWILILLIHTAYFTGAHVHFVNAKASVTDSSLKLVLQGCEATV